MTFLKSTRTLIAAALLSTSLATPVTSMGSATGLASEWTQLANNIQLSQIVALEGTSMGLELDQLATQITQLQTQIASYQAILQNLKSLPESFLREALGPLVELRKIGQQAGALAHDAAKMNWFLESGLIKDAGFNQDPINRANLSERFRDWSEQWNNTAQAAIKSAGLSMRDLDDDAKMIDKISARIGNEKGHLQALQVGNELAGALAGQMTDLRGLIAQQNEVTTLAWGRKFAADEAMEAERLRFETELEYDRRRLQDSGYQPRTIREILQETRP
jgi:P-type conjugative transfer protein TrbJ